MHLRNTRTPRTQGKSIDSAILRVVRHCREIRSRLQAGALSVHARAAGAQPSNCYGGIMLGIDLSRAFDNLTRDVLQHSLVHARVDGSAAHPAGNSLPMHLSA